jgi:hypothetical protein
MCVVVRAFLAVVFPLLSFAAFAADQPPAPAKTSCCVCLYDEAPKMLYPHEFEAQCAYWYRHQTAGCGQIAICNARGCKSNELPGPTGCTDLKIAYRGHAAENGDNIGIDLAGQIKTALKDSPNAKYVDYQSTACSIFWSQQEIQRQANAVRAVLPKKAIARVLANQSDVITDARTGVPTTASPLRLTITADALQMQFFGCNAVGAECDSSAGNPFYTCLDNPNPNPTMQTCCEGKWLKPGARCPSLGR